MLGVLVRQNDLKDLRSFPDFLESDCATTKQQMKCIKRRQEEQMVAVRHRPSGEDGWDRLLSALLRDQAARVSSESGFERLPETLSEPIGQAWMHSPQRRQSAASPLP